MSFTDVNVVHCLFACNVVIFYWAIKQFWKWYSSPLFKLPSAIKYRGLKEFLLGSQIDIYREPFMKPQYRWWMEAGIDVPMIHYTTFMGAHALLVLDADIIKDVLMDNSNPRKFLKRYPLLKNLCGDSLISLNGNDWKRLRRICQPAFFASNLNARLSESVQKRASLLIDCWTAAQGKRIDLASHFSAITLDILGDVGFSYNFNALNMVEKWSRNDDSNDVVLITEELFAAFSESLKKNSLLRIGLKSIGLNSLEKYIVPSTKRTTDCVDRLIDGIISNARNTMKEPEQSGKDKNEENAYSVIKLLVAAKHNQAKATFLPAILTHSELRDCVKTFLIAGHETVATWCTWATYCLSIYPDIQQKIYEEITSHSPSGSTSLESIDSLSYFHAFLMEVLRLYPPIPIFYRYIIKPQKVGEIFVPANTRIAIPTYLMHRHPLYWGEDALSFKPERWLKEKSPMSHRFAFLPFSEGERKCIGYRFAVMEAKQILAPIIRAFHFQLSPEMRNVKIEYQIFLALVAKQNLLVHAKRRN